MPDGVTAGILERPFATLPVLPALAMRVFARRERSYPGAQLTLFEAEDGWRYTLWVTNRPATTAG